MRQRLSPSLPPSLGNAEQGPPAPGLTGAGSSLLASHVQMIPPHSTAAVPSLAPAPTSARISLPVPALNRKQLSF